MPDALPTRIDSKSTLDAALKTVTQLEKNYRRMRERLAALPPNPTAAAVAAAISGESVAVRADTSAETAAQLRKDGEKNRAAFDALVSRVKALPNNADAAAILAALKG